jgi:hypothetical protein
MPRTGWRTLRLTRVSEAPPNKIGTVIAPLMAALRFNAMPGVKVIHSN